SNEIGGLTHKTVVDDCTVLSLARLRVFVKSPAALILRCCAGSNCQPEATVQAELLRQIQISKLPPKLAANGDDPTNPENRSHQQKSRWFRHDNPREVDI